MLLCKHVLFALSTTTDTLLGLCKFGNDPREHAVQQQRIRYFNMVMEDVGVYFCVFSRLVMKANIFFTQIKPKHNSENTTLLPLRKSSAKN